MKDDRKHYVGNQFSRDEVEEFICMGSNRELLMKLLMWKQYKKI